MAQNGLIKIAPFAFKILIYGEVPFLTVLTWLGCREFRFFPQCYSIYEDFSPECAFPADRNLYDPHIAALLGSGQLGADDVRQRLPVRKCRVKHYFISYPPGDYYVSVDHPRRSGIRTISPHCTSPPRHSPWFNCLK